MLTAHLRFDLLIECTVHYASRNGSGDSNHSVRAWYTIYSPIQSDNEGSRRRQAAMSCGKEVLQCIHLTGKEVSRGKVTRERLAARILRGSVENYYFVSTSSWELRRHLPGQMLRISGVHVMAGTILLGPPRLGFTYPNASPAPLRLRQ